MQGAVCASGSTGKERDAESGLDYFGARYYASNMGRFSSPDDGSDQLTGEPQSWNLYSYVGNNPLRQVDLDGHLGLNSGPAAQCSSNASGSGCATPAEIKASQQKYGAQAQQQVSQAGQDFIKGYEKLSLTVYDASGKRKAGDWTIGYGHQITKGAGPITLPEAEALFQSDVSRMASHVAADLNVPVSQNQFDALVSLRFNAGANAITPPVADLNSTDHATMGDFTNHYITAGGVPSRGLELRRAAEWRIFSEGVYDASH